MTDNKNSTVAKEFLIGCVSGFSKIYTGQPFDIVKVRVQSSGGNPLAVVTNIIKNEGVFALWKGSLPPLIGVGATVALQFGVNENVKKAISASNGGRKFTFSELFLAGWLGGFANCIVSTPAEHFRILMQTQSKANPVYSGSIDCMKKIYGNYGLKGVYKGAVPTICRDSFGYGAYFALYTTLMNYFCPGQTRTQYNLGKVGLAGSIAGIVFWMLVFPFDIVKTRKQTDSFENPKYKGMADGFKKTYAQGGLKGFYKGFLPCFLRAIPVNGAVFVLYEMLYRQFVAPPTPKLLRAV